MVVSPSAVSAKLCKQPTQHTCKTQCDIWDLTDGSTTITNNIHGYGFFKQE